MKIVVSNICLLHRASMVVYFCFARYQSPNDNFLENKDRHC